LPDNADISPLSPTHWPTPHSFITLAYVSAAAICIQLMAKITFHAKGCRLPDYGVERSLGKADLDAVLTADRRDH
jgi:hypothetical protein